MKRLTSMLCMILILSLAGGAMASSDPQTKSPLKPVRVNVEVESEDAAFAVLKYKYNTDVFKYAGTTIAEGIVSGTRDGQIAIARLGEALNGSVGTVFFDVLDGAKKGAYMIDFAASGAFNEAEKATKLTVKDQEAYVETLVNSFVRRCYEVILNRKPDEGGLEDWSDQLEAKKMAAADIISGFMNSPEFTGQNNSNEDTVEVLYEAMLDRASDEGGKKDWVSRLEAGGNSDMIINGFCGSQESKALCSEYGIEEGVVKEKKQGLEGFVERCYSEALGRGSDEAGFNSWCSILRERVQTPQQVAWGFVFSPEMNAAQKIR